MSPGALARLVLGDRFHAVAKIYRSVFVNLDAVTDVVSREIPNGATILDVGGGDGAPLNYLLEKRPDLRVVMLDLSETVGGAVEERFSDRVVRIPKTSLREYGGPRIDAILIMDVVHHVPVNERGLFFRDVSDVIRELGVGRVIVKDFAPGTLRSFAGWLADRYISGDRNVSFESLESMKRRLIQALGVEFWVTETGLLEIDSPNYCLVSRRV